MAGTHNPTNALFSSDITSPGYIQSVASSKSKTKENLRTQELMPAEILENSGGIQMLLEAYYTFMNMEEFIYTQNETYTDIVLDDKAVFRVDDPNNANDHFFVDADGGASTLTLTDSAGTVTSYTLTSTEVNITNGNNLPGSLATATTPTGKTFNVQFKRPNESGYVNYNTQTAVLTTPVKYWAGPGASYALNTIEESMDIDSTAAAYLELIQKEIAAVIPRSIPVNKRNLYKAIIQYYRVRGSADSIEIFFRLLFDDEVEVKYPWDETLIPSSGNWEVNPSLPKGGIYLDKKGFLSDTIKIQDSLRYQKFSYLIRTGQNLSSWDYFYERLVHPAGFKYFAEILIQLMMTREALGDDQKLLRELTYVGGPKHGQLTGESFFGYGRTNRFTLSSMPDIQPGVIGIEDIPLLVEIFTAMFLPDTSVQIHESARLSLTVETTPSDPNYGEVVAVEIVESGYGYQSAPTVTVNGIAQSGQTITDAVITLSIDSNGKVDGATITNGGANYQSAFASVAANPNISKIASIDVVPDQNKKYSTTPNIIFDAPTSKDSFGVLLPTNVTATGKYLLEPTSIDRIEVTNGGSGYTSRPLVIITPQAGGPGSGASAIAHIENGQVSYVEVVNGGSGYIENPIITIIGSATAVSQLVPSRIASAQIIGPGFGYVLPPNVYISSKAKNEDRAKTTPVKRLVECNFSDVDPAYTKITNPVQTSGSVRGRTLFAAPSGTAEPLRVGVLTSGQDWTISQTGTSNDKSMGGYEVTAVASGYRSRPENNYYNLKSNILNNHQLYGFNATLEELGDVELQSTSISDINKHNVNSFEDSYNYPMDLNP